MNRRQLGVSIEIMVVDRVKIALNLHFLILLYAILTNTENRTDSLGSVMNRLPHLPPFPFPKSSRSAAHPNFPFRSHTQN